MRGAIKGLLVWSAIAGVFGMLHGSDIVMDGRIVESRPVAGTGFIAFCLVAMLPMALVWARPRPLALWLWSLALWIGTIALLAGTFEIKFDHWGADYIYDWPYHLFPWLGWPLAIACYVVIPAGGPLYWVSVKLVEAHRNRPPPPPKAPTARVVRGGRAD